MHHPFRRRAPLNPGQQASPLPGDPGLGARQSPNLKALLKMPGKPSVPQYSLPAKYLLQKPLELVQRTTR
jgi:hypothetical protein